MLKKLIVILMANALLLTALVGCSKPTVDTKGSINEITLSEGWSFESFAPLTLEASNHGIMYYTRNFYETLVSYDNGEIVPGLAETWEVSEDGLVYTFHLRENVKFTDGEPFNAEAVKKNLELIPLNLGIYNGYFGTVTTLFDKIIAVDTYTVEVHLTRPYYAALNDFSMEMVLAMVSPNAYNEDGSYKDTLKTTTLGTGPYMYQGDTDGTTYTFVKNPEYWGEEPQLERFYVKVILDNDARQLALRNGEVDILVGARQMSYDSFSELKKAGYGALISESSSNTQYLAFNVEKSPFDDMNVRRAASYAIDKASICKSVLGGIVTEANSLFPLNLPYCNVELVTYEYNTEKAIKLLEDAGWVDPDGDGVREKDGIPLKGDLVYATDDTVMDDLALVVCAQLKEVGMDIKPKGMEIAASFDEYAKGNYSIARTFTYGGVWDPHTTITNANPEQGNDVLNRAFTLVDNAGELIDALNVAVDKEKIKEAYDFILSGINDKALLVPLYYTNELVVYNNDTIKDYIFEGELGYIYVPSIKLK
jgi:nickel transport system substrate-binding protein